MVAANVTYTGLVMAVNTIYNVQHTVTAKTEKEVHDLGPCVTFRGKFGILKWLHYVPTPLLYFL